MASHRSLSCLTKLKLLSIIVQFNTTDKVMMTICASHINSLIVYEHFGCSAGGRSIYCGFQLQTMLIMIRCQTWAYAIINSNTQGSCLLINSAARSKSINCPYLCISTTAELCHAKMISKPKCGLHVC